MLDEREFHKRCDAALEDLAKRLNELGDAHDFEVEGGSGKLEIEFEDDGTSFKLGWSEAAQDFVLEKTGETLKQVMARILTEKLGEAVVV